MSDLLTRYDFLLQEEGPAAIVLKQWLKPVGGDIFSPPTYANPSQKKGDPPVYNIDRYGETPTLKKTFERFKKAHVFMDAERTEQGRERSVCIVDSIPSQANRIEPAFADRIADGKLVPKVTIKVKLGEEEEEVNLLEAGHRAADAIVRFTRPPFCDDLATAILARKKGDSLPLARLAPTSLVFGMWDSRATGVKVPRLVNSIIRAYDVIEYRRSAQYFPATDYSAAGVAAEKGDAALRKLSDEGMAEVPATFGLGGVEARGGICREAALNLSALRDIATDDKEQNRKLHRYLLGLSLVAITWFDGKTLDLRQGCQLVADREKPMVRRLMNADGTDQPFEIDRESAVEYARAAAEDFHVTQDVIIAQFDPKKAKEALRKKSAGEED